MIHEMPTTGAPSMQLAPGNTEQVTKTHQSARPMRGFGCLQATRQLHTFAPSLLEAPDLPEFDIDNWYPALLAARKEYLLDRMEEINQLPPTEALAAMSEFSDDDLQMLGLKKVQVK